MIITAPPSGKHVLVDKPIGRSIAEAREIARAAEHARIKIDQFSEFRRRMGHGWKQKGCADPADGLTD